MTTIAKTRLVRSRIKDSLKPNPLEWQHEEFGELVKARDFLLWSAWVIDRQTEGRDPASEKLGSTGDRIEATRDEKQHSGTVRQIVEAVNQPHLADLS
jgi:hypothetical protein